MNSLKLAGMNWFFTFKPIYTHRVAIVNFFRDHKGLLSMVLVHGINLFARWLSCLCTQNMIAEVKQLS
jgi:hypothetical protein